MIGDIAMKRSSILALLLLLVSCNDSNQPEEFSRVFMGDGAEPCAGALGRPINETEQILITNGIDVVSSECGVFTDSMGAVICTDYEIIHVFEIHPENVEDAGELGFIELSEYIELVRLTVNPPMTYKTKECRQDAQ